MLFVIFCITQPAVSLKAGKLILSRRKGERNVDPASNDVIQS